MSIHSTLFTLSLSNPSCSIPNKLKKKKNKPQISIPKTSKSKPFPKSTPTPLLINQNPQILTKIQALERIVSDLESSAKRGVYVADTQTFASLLETCFNLRAIDHGIRIHRLIPPKILRKNVGVASKLVRLYAVNGCIEDAHKVFDEMSKRDDSSFVWNSLIYGYVEVGKYEDAIALYFQMIEEGVEIDSFTFPRVLKACGGIGSVCVGEEINRDVIRYGFFSDVFVLNSLVDMYAKCGNIVKSRKVFDLIPFKDSVSWNSMITGYVHHGLLKMAMEVFCGMIEAGFEPDDVTISAILSRVSSIRIGVQIHGWVLRRGIGWSLSIANSLITLYSYHGLLEQARWLFKNMPRKDRVSWNSIISAHREDPLCLDYFRLMESEGARPDGVTFVSLLSACAHLGYVREGERLFALMLEKYGIFATMEHYACMVNLFGRAGLIEEAYEVVKGRTEGEVGASAWGALLYACYVNGIVDVGEIAAEKLFELEPDNEHNFELLMKIYDGLGRMADMERVRKMMVDRGLDRQIK